MWCKYILVILCYLFETYVALLCFNCSSNHLNTNNCVGDFSFPYLRGSFNNSVAFLKNCTSAAANQEGAMCFVRSWQARAAHVWAVQRGCYYPNKDDPLPFTMDSPNRAMSCRYQRFPDGEYKLCLCQANWCNETSSNVINYTFLIIMAFSVYVFNSNVFLMDIIKFYKAV